MKKLILLLLLLAVSTVAVSQSTADLKNSRWINGYYEVEPVGTTFWPVLQHTRKYCTTDSDTIIGSESYLQLLDCGNTPMTYHGGVRIENKQWYFISKDSTSEMLLYDFSLEVGDTLKEPFYVEGTAGGSGFDTPVLQQIDTIVENGHSYRRFTFKNFSASWIEGIGNTQGFLWHPYPNISGYELSLECFSKDDTTHYVSSSYHTSNFNEACQLNFSLGEEFTGSVNIYPNPSKGTFTLELPQHLNYTTVKIISSTGKTIIEKAIEGGISSMTFNLPEGSYYAFISGENGSAAIPLTVIY